MTTIGIVRRQKFNRFRVELDESRLQALVHLVQVK